MQKDQRRLNPEPRVERGAGHAYASPGRDQTYVEIAHCLKEDATEKSASRNDPLANQMGYQESSLSPCICTSGVPRKRSPEVWMIAHLDRQE